MLNAAIMFSWTNINTVQPAHMYMLWNNQCILYNKCHNETKLMVWFAFHLHVSISQEGQCAHIFNSSQPVFTHQLLVLGRVLQSLLSCVAGLMGSMSFSARSSTA